MSTAALPKHPVTGLTALGYTSRGPIWPQLGGDGTGDGNTGDTGETDGDASGEGAASGSASTGASGDSDAGTGGADSGAGTGETGGESATGEPSKRGGNSTATDPKVRAARNEAAQAKKEFEDFKTAIGKALGYVPDEADTDPAKLAARLADSSKEATDAKAELAVFRAAPKDVDAQALVDSRRFTNALHKLDQSADDFDEKLAELITAEVEKNPAKFKIAAAPAAPKPPGQSGADTGAGKGESGGQLTYAQYQALTPAERIKATREGRANQVLGRK